MGEDISKRTIAVLLLLTVVLSVAGTWSLLIGGVITPQPSASQASPNIASAEVAFGIREVPQSSARGEVRFGIREA